MKPPPVGSITQLGVTDLMTHDVVTVSPETTLLDAMRIMVAKGIRHVPIVDDGVVVAIVSDRNMRTMVTEHGDAEERRRYLSATSVMAHASHPVTTIGLDGTAQEAARLFVDQRIGALPVVDDDGRLIGIITSTDLLLWMSTTIE